MLGRRSSGPKNRATESLSAPATCGWIQEDKYNAQNHCYRRRARLSHLGESACVRDPRGQRHRQERRAVRQEEEELDQEVGAQHRSLRRQKEKEEEQQQHGEEVEPYDRSLCRQKEKEEEQQQHGEEVEPYDRSLCRQKE